MSLVLLGIIDDVHELSDYIPAVVTFVNAAIMSGCKKILFHCHQGRSRSAAMLMLYLLSIGRSLEEVVDRVYKARPMAQLNPDFCRQVEEFAELRQEQLTTLPTSYPAVRPATMLSIAL